MCKVVLVYGETYLKYDFGPTHPLRPERYRLTVELIKALDLVKHGIIELQQPRQATDDELSLVHNRDYIDFVKAASLTGYGYLDYGDTPAFKGVYEVSAYKVGGSLVAADLVMTGKCDHAFNIGGGLHHAASGRAAGFCVFNDVAITAKYLLEKYKVKRLLIVDFDAHHGDGTQEVLYNEPRALKIDLHESGRYLYPGKGFVDEMGEGDAKGFMVNVPLPPDTFNDAYLKAFDEVVVPLFKNFKPEVVIQQTGVDTHYTDILTHMALTSKGYRSYLKAMHSLVHEVGAKYVMLGGGGYSLSAVSRVWTIATSIVAGREIPVNLELPDGWKKLYQSITYAELPSIIDDEKEPELSEARKERVMREVEESIAEVKSKIFPLHGLSP
ncbi:MAG: acetoin utilization protein AcuC [Candidatus Nezhaarchaeales archaeon]